MMTRWVARTLSMGALVLAALAACSDFEATAPEPSPDAGPPEAAADAPAIPDGDASDGDGGVVACARDAPFTSVRRVDGVNSNADEGYPRLTPDERVIYFQRFTSGTGAIYRAERPSRASAFGMPVEVGGLPSNPRHPFPSADEQTLLFVVLAVTPQRYEMWIAERPSPGAQFGNARPLLPQSPGSDRIEPVVTADGREIFFGDRPTSGGTMELFRAFAFDGGYADAGAVAEVNSLAADQGPTLSEDALDLYFYSDRGAGAVGTIWRAHRDSRTELFRAPERVDELVPDSGYTEPGYLSTDGCRLYFYSNMDPSTGADLYVAERTPAR